MAFRFQWPYFSEEFIQEAKTMLTNALNKGNKPAVIVDHITVKELDMGTLPPELEMLEMGELSMERFRGIFKLTYNGDAHIVLQTKVQANPMNVKKTDNPSYTRRGILAADQPLVVPMLLRISDFKLRGIIVLVVDQIKGITLVFKNDPLESVLVSSTFDSITPIQRFLQSEIEKQLRNLFQEDLPTAIHNLSQQFTKKPEDASRQQQQQHQKEELQGRGIYDGGLATPSVSQNPSRRSSVIPPRRRPPGRTNSEPDYSMGAQYDDEGLKPVRKPASATVRSESPGSGSRRDPHTEYSGDAQRDLLEESLSHESNNPIVGRRSQPPSRRSSRLPERHDHAEAPTPSTLERLSMRDETAHSLLGVAESTHLANQFERLTHSNQTISPFAQNLEHFAFRSVPPKRPASVQYYSHSGNSRTQSPGSRSGSNSVSGMDISKDGLGHLSNKTAGYPSGYGQYRSDMAGYGQSSPRISHRRLQGRVGIRRYAMQMGAGNDPRELSDQDSDEYNDVEEALSESEYVYVDKNPRPSSDFDRNGQQESQYMGKISPSGKKGPSITPSTSSNSLRTVDGHSSSPLAGQSPPLRPQLRRRRSSKHDKLYHPSGTMPGGFSSNVDARSWTGSGRQHAETDSSRTESRPTSNKNRLSPEEALHRDFASMQLNGNKDNSYPSASLSPKVAPASTIQPNGNKAPSTTTARTFSNTQRPSALSPRLPPPEPLKRDKRNSSILSSRRVSSVGIGLGVLSKEDDKKLAAAATAAAGGSKATGVQVAPNGMPRPSLYKTKPLSTRSGWFEREGT
ncbi:ERMES complex subunit [Linnemannia schmuckeri]|uniref:Mitochondrial distribution and morphology protein 34 n=1 Tax=Linnemannia schmuckeri TaxID=64567 RepID=A0A9P5RXG6_9FUNG|nr:ERMES complex subunit [Linnemannia schmuckeri]